MYALGALWWSFGVTLSHQSNRQGLHTSPVLLLNQNLRERPRRVLSRIYREGNCNWSGKQSFSMGVGAEEGRGFSSSFLHGLGLARRGPELSHSKRRYTHKNPQNTTKNKTKNLANLYTFLVWLSQKMLPQYRQWCFRLSVSVVGPNVSGWGVHALQAVTRVVLRLFLYVSPVRR